MKKLFLFVLMSIFLVVGISFAGPTIHRSGVKIMAPLEIDHNTETLNADRTILITDKPIQFLDANVADRNVTLPAEASSTDLVFTILNVSNGVGEDLVIRDDTPTTLITIGPGQGIRVSCDGTNWKVWFDNGIYYDKVENIVKIIDGLEIGSGQIFVADGSAVAPSFAFYNNKNSGMFAIGSAIGFTSEGTQIMVLADEYVQFHKSFYLSGSTTPLYGTSSSNGDLYLLSTSHVTKGDVIIQPSGGNVGIGTVSPDTLLELQKELADAEETISAYHNTEVTAPIITLRKADNVASAPGLVDDNAVLGRINFKGYDGSGWHTGAKIEARIDGTPSDGTDMPAELVFATTPEASGSPTEWMVLMPSGQLKMKESSDPAALADHVFFYGKDVAGTGEAFAADAAANAAQLTPHNFTLFEPDVTEAYPWSYYAENKALGIKINVDMAGMIRAVEGLTGKTFIYTQNIAKDVDLEKVYKDAWIADYIKAGTQEAEVTKEQALEIVQVDVDKWYEIEIIDPETGEATITKKRKKISEKITGYDLTDNEVKPKIEIIWETEKVDKIQIKENVRFNEINGRFYMVTKPSKAQAMIAATTGFTFNPPKWLGDRLKK